MRIDTCSFIRQDMRISPFLHMLNWSMMICRDLNKSSGYRSVVAVWLLSGQDRQLNPGRPCVHGPVTVPVLRAAVKIGAGLQREIEGGGRRAAWGPARPGADGCDDDDEVDSRSRGGRNVVGRGPARVHGAGGKEVISSPCSACARKRKARSGMSGQTTPARPQNFTRRNLPFVYVHMHLICTYPHSGGVWCSTTALVTRGSGIQHIYTVKYPRWRPAHGNIKVALPLFSGLFRQKRLSRRVHMPTINLLLTNLSRIKLLVVVHTFVSILRSSRINGFVMCNACMCRIHRPFKRRRGIKSYSHQYMEG